MKKLIGRVARVADASQYQALRAGKEGRRRGEAAAEGHVPVYVGEEMERFEVRAELLGRPAFVELLRRSAQEYGYEQRGPLRIPCPVPLFRRVLSSLLASGGLSDEAEEALLRSPSDEDFGSPSAS